MVLAAVVDHQSTGDALSTFVSPDATPTNGALYLVFTFGRQTDADTGAHRAPTLTGTNGWNTTWTRIAGAQAIYSYAGQEYGGIDCFWGVASSSTPGAFTVAYGSPNLTSHNIHVIRIDGTPNLSAPIGATGSGSHNTAAASTVTATMTASPAGTSMIVAVAASDHNSGTMTPSAGYTALGSLLNDVNAPAGISQPMYDDTPASATLSATFSDNDILAISAVEVVIGATPGAVALSATADLSVAGRFVIAQRSTGFSATADIAATAQAVTPGVLSAVIVAQETGEGAASFTTTPLTPTSGALYLVFTVGRLQDSDVGGHRVPTLTGTNGWNTTWNRVAAAQAIYSYAGQQYGGMECFWGVASSGVAGTLTTTYGTPNYSSGGVHVIRIDGGPGVTSPIGATASANDATAAATTVSGTLTGTPAASSVVVACAMSDHGSGTMTPGGGYASLGTMLTSAGPAHISQPMYDVDAASTTVATTFSAADILALSAVEVRISGVVVGAASLSATAGIAVVGSAPSTSPYKVANLVATAVSASEVDLTWDDVAALTGEAFDIERNGAIVLRSYIGPHAVGDPYRDTGLSGATHYDYRVRAVDQSPSGLLFGTPFNSDGAANALLDAAPHSLRFRCVHTGTFAGIKNWWIFSTTADGTGPYGGGTGGHIVVELRTDDGTANHFPTSTVLSTFDIPDPMERDGNVELRAPIYAYSPGLGGRLCWNFREITMPAVSLTAGTLYHLVYRNIDAAPNTNFVSLDYIYNAAATPNMQPGISDTDLAGLHYSGGWAIELGYTPIYEVHYADGFKQGFGYQNGTAGFPHSIYGVNRIRSLFTPVQTFKVRTVMVRLRRVGSPGALQVALIDDTGATIGSGSISGIPLTDTWVSYTFTDTRKTLAAGRQYRLELSATGDASNRYLTSGFLDGAWAHFQTAPFPEGRAQEDIGAGWVDTFPSYGADWQLYFVS